MKQAILERNNYINKKNGSYYTPQIMADFIIKWLFNRRHYSIDDNINILEPSAGDGIFIDSLIRNAINKKKIKSAQVNIVEKNKKEIKKIEKLCKENLKNKQIKFNFFQEDFLKFQKNDETKYDLVIANPPYIKKNYLTKEQLSFCKDIHELADLSKSEIKNIWTAFLVSSIKKLKDNGSIGFVLPAEFLQVAFTSEIRDFITNNFDKVEIFAFNELVFDAEQDVIIILATKKYLKKIVSFYQVKKLEDLKKPELIRGNNNTNRDTLSKWTNYILSSRDLSFLEKIKTKFKIVNEYCISQVGIVTAVNNFFIITKDRAKELGIISNCKPIIQKSSLIKNLFIIDKESFSKVEKSGKPCYLLALEEVSKNYLSKPIIKYLKDGESQGLNKRYKCNIRKYWYSVPSVWPSEGFFIKRTDKTPRIIVNEANVNVTDAFYRIKMLSGYNIKSLSFSFCNTFSFIYSELEGRFYGGGVLELTPNEFKKIPVPYMNIDEHLYDKFVSMASKQETGRELRDFVDKNVLRDYYKISDQDMQRLNVIYNKLYYRRIKK
jgi:adenine-specific DNA-methyltransferase